MTASSAESVDVGSTDQVPPLFVINLAASTSPMALSNPSSPELKRYTFFVSRHREEGRERFRLHMGYFPSQEQAEALLAQVREIYPAAWAGPAPANGAGRRARSAAAVNSGSMVRASAPVTPVAPAALPELPASGTPALSRLATAVTVAETPRTAEDPAALAAMSNVRDVIAELSQEVPVLAAPAASTADAPEPAAELTSADALSLLEEPTPAAPPVAAPVAPRVAALAEAPAPVAAPAKPRVAAPAALPPLKNPFEGLEQEAEVRLVTPEDTQTLTDIKLDRQNNAPPCFAVQLVWSVTPIDADAMPHLAIFDAYTLYNVEGNRQGRKWYGLRLGFFSDPNSASQVANYVRSDYRNVAVVPVAVKERDHARGGAPQAGAQPAPAPGSPSKTTDADFKREAMEGFELLADDRPVPARRDIGTAAPAQAGAAAVAKAPVRPVAATPVQPAAPRSMGKPTGKRAVARRRAPNLPAGRTVSAGVGGPDVLESTLNILGASTLSLDEGGNEIITDAAARKPAAKKSSAGARFSKLLSKLGGG